MKTDVTPKGAITYANGDGVYINGVPHEYAAYIDRWEDWHGEPHEGTGPAALTYEAYRNTGFMMQFFRSNQRDSLFTAFQMSHTWDVGSGVRPHMHVIPMASGSGDTIFTYAYAWAAYGDLFPPATGWVSGSVTSSWTPDDQYRHKVISFGAVAAPTGSQESMILVFKCERQSDSYTSSKDHGTASANLAMLDLDLHYLRIKAGSLNEWGDSF
jgi:hypothetical protein